MLSNRLADWVDSIVNHQVSVCKTFTKSGGKYAPDFNNNFKLI